MLLILDQAEHVVRSVAKLAQLVLERCPGVSMMIASRRSLPTLPALLCELAPLEVAPGLARQELPAVQLFLACAQAACPALRLGDRLDEVIELCRRLDGLPLAIELAAGLTRALPLEALLNDTQVFHLISHINVPGHPRGRTVAESVRWSSNLLTDQQRQFLHQLARFPEPLTIEDIQRFGLVGEDDGPRAVSLLAELVNASLVQVYRTPVYRYRVLAIVREHLGVRSA
jgi:predicted ATPase